MKLTPTNHAALSYFAYRRNTTITDAVNSILRAFFLQYYQTKDSKTLAENIEKALIPRKRSVLDKLIALAFGEKKRRPPLRFKDVDITPKEI